MNPRMTSPMDDESKSSPRRKRFPWEWLLAGVVIILILLVVVIVPQLGSPGPVRAPVKAAITQISALGTALNLFHADNGFYPKGKDGLRNLVQKPPQATPNWKPYLDHIPLDPWGHAYIYECPGRHNTNSYDLYSTGPDKLAGTADDITNWR